MMAPARLYRESPVFRNISAASFSYAFEITIEERRRGGWVARTDRCALRVRNLHQQLLGKAEFEAAHKSLIEPVRSFLDDVTTGPTGTNGRPMFFAASGASFGDIERDVTIVRPADWPYDYEGSTISLAPADGEQSVPMRLVDSFCLFESGRLFYILTLTQPRDEACIEIDEYAVLQLQQLAIDPETLAVDAAYLGFDWKLQPGVQSLASLARARLDFLSNRSKDEAAPTAIADLMRPLGLLKDNERLTVSAASLKSLGIGIEDETLLAAGRRADRLLDEEKSAQRQEGARSKNAEEEEFTEADRAWARALADWTDTLPAHDSGERYPRTLLAFAGIAQGVPDFQRQDESEIHDSTRPTTKSVESMLYVHPCFLLEIAKSWRSFDQKREDAGTCPYLLLKWMVSVHDEIVIADMEQRLDEMIYDADAVAAHAMPMHDLQRVLRSARRVFGGDDHLIENNLEKRVAMFRWASIHRSGNIFRYPREKQALEKIQEAMGTEPRFKRAYETVDRIEDLVEDVSDLKSTYSENRTNNILFVLALLGIIGAAKDIREMVFGAGAEGADYRLFLIALGLLALVIVRVFWPVRRKS
jgi:hypothetical protein